MVSLLTPKPSELDSQFSFHKFRKIRLQIAWIFALVLVVFAKSTNSGFLAGVPIVLLGEAVRIWAHGYLRKARRLAMDGPYAYVRNPLYVGNFLIGLGFCVIIYHPLIVGLFAVGFYAVYWVTVRGEEQRLAFKFGDDYAKYVKHVPRFIPRLFPYRERTRAPFHAYRIWGHGEHVTILGIIVLLLALYLRQELYQEHSPVTGEICFIALSIFILVGAIGFLLKFRHKKKRK